MTDITTLIAVLQNSKLDVNLEEPDKIQLLRDTLNQFLKSYAKIKEFKLTRNQAVQILINLKNIQDPVKKEYTNKLIDKIIAQLASVNAQKPAPPPKDELTLITQGVIRKLLTTWSGFASEAKIVNLGNGIYTAFYQGQAQKSPEAEKLVPVHQFLTPEEYAKIVNYFKDTLEHTYKGTNVKFGSPSHPQWYYFKLWGASKLIKEPKAYDERLYCNVQVRFLPPAIYAIIVALVSFLKSRNVSFYTGDIYVNGKIPKSEDAAVNRVDPLVLYFSGNNPALCDEAYKEVVKAINKLPPDCTNQAKNALGKKEGLVTTVPNVLPEQKRIAQQIGWPEPKISYGQYVGLALAYAINKTYDLSAFKMPIDEKDLATKTIQGMPVVKKILKDQFLLQF